MTLAAYALAMTLGHLALLFAAALGLITGASAMGANLARCRFVHADAAGIDLRKASLGFANLSHANLTDADLREADLSRACLHRVRREGANPGGANFKGATETDPDLARAEDFQRGTR